MQRTKFFADQTSTEFDSLCEQAFSSEAHLEVNKTLLHRFGPITAIFISNLLHKACQNDGWFYLTHQQQMKQTGIKSEHLLRQCKKNLRSLGVIKTKMMGVPIKEYYKIDYGKLSVFCLR